MGTNQTKRSKDGLLPFVETLLDDRTAIREDAFKRARTQVDPLVERTPLLSEREVARLLMCEPKTLQNRRHDDPDQLPPHLTLPGRRGTVYPREEFVDYLAELLVGARGRRVHRI